MATRTPARGPERQRRRIRAEARRRFGSAAYALRFTRGRWTLTVDHEEFGGLRVYVARPEPGNVVFEGR
jgi:hypothetical protein